jgi:hypothetical protein
VKRFLSVMMFAVLPTAAIAADEFVCSEIAQTARATDGTFIPVKVAPESRLTIRIDTAKATNSSITWSGTGDAEVDNHPNHLTAGSRVRKREGEIFATLFGELDTMTAVGTLLIGRSGDLWITESTAAGGKIAHYIIQAKCTRK